MPAQAAKAAPQRPVSQTPARNSFSSSFSPGGTPAPNEQPLQRQSPVSQDFMMPPQNQNPGFGPAVGGLASSDLIKKIVILIAIVAGTSLIASGVIALMRKSSSDNDPKNPGQPLIPDDTPGHINIAVADGQTPMEAAVESFPKVTEDVSEVIFFDKAGQPLPLNEFAARSEITIPSYVSEILSPTYYFFLTKNSGEAPRGMLLLQAKETDSKKKTEVLKRWEVYMHKDLRNFVLLGKDFDYTASGSFSTFSSSGKHPGGRYVNFIDDGTVSLNYLIMRDKILIANSFAAFEKGIEYVKNRSDL